MVALGLLVRGYFLDGRGRLAVDREPRPLVKYDRLGERFVQRAARQHFHPGCFRWWRLTIADMDVNPSHVNVHGRDGLAWPLPTDNERGYANYG
jgi:hypothetical protein